MFLSPRKQNLKDIWINSAWSLVAWVLWSVLIIVLTFMISSKYNVVSIIQGSTIESKVSAIFPFILSIITLLWTTVSSFLTYKILNMTDPEKYKKNWVLFGQLAFFQIVCYILVTPLYIYIWLYNYENILLIYLFHVLLIVFWTSLILEIFNNYRYILLWLYWSIIWLFACIIFSTYIINNSSESYSKIIILVVLLPLANFITITLKQLFELLYYYYYKHTSLDPMWDIFHQIEIEEERKMREEEEFNSI